MLTVCSALPGADGLLTAEECISRSGQHGDLLLSLLRLLSQSDKVGKLHQKCPVHSQGERVRQTCRRPVARIFHLHALSSLSVW